MTSDGSRVFFESDDALTGVTTNHSRDVYEWERSGTGTCDQAPGCVSLISTGTAGEASVFLDASEDGSDVFFLTRQPLAGGDSDQEVDVYDARVGGGYTAAEATGCTGTVCQGLPAATPTFATPSSVTFEGTGNFPAAPGTVVKPKALTRAQRLARALKACSKRPKRQRASCRARARKRYGPPRARNAHTRNGRTR